MAILGVFFEKIGKRFGLTMLFSPIFLYHLFLIKLNKVNIYKNRYSIYIYKEILRKKVAKIFRSFWLNDAKVVAKK